MSLRCFGGTAVQMPHAFILLCEMILWLFCNETSEPITKMRHGAGNSA